MRRLLSILLFLFCLSQFNIIKGQENPWEDMLKKEVEVINPNYKPVIGAGLTFFDFRGDIRNKNSYPTVGNIGYKINLLMYLDPKKYLKSNLFFCQNQITVNERSFENPQKNLNFRSDLVIFGVSLQYDFKPFIKKDFINPFISIGAEYVYFNTKGDLKNSSGNYNYWPDGTIRNQPFGSQNAALINRDYIYETDLRKENLSIDPSLQTYSRYALAIPLEAGFDFYISYRASMHFAVTYHYAFTDYIDNVAESNTPVKGDSKNDCFVSANIALHLDLFSDPKTRIQNLLFADVDFDYTMYSDEDLDMVFDGWDRCPGTQYGVSVDTSGCPYDADNDGVPDYKDQQEKTRKNAIVDLKGIEITDDTLLHFFTYYEAVDRSQVDFYLKLYSEQSPQLRKKKNLPIPEKLKPADLNNDGIISYEEVLKTINAFYEFENKFTYKDIDDLIHFFFSQ